MLAHAFIVTNSLNPPDALQVVHHAEQLGLPLVPSPVQDDATLSFSMEHGERINLLFVPRQLPDLDKFPTGPTATPAAELGASSCHLVVSLQGDSDDPILTKLLLSALCAALTNTTDAVGVLMNDGAVFHRPEQLRQMVIWAGKAGRPPGLLLGELTGAAEPDGRVSYLSHGLVDLGRPEEIFVVCEREDSDGLKFLIQFIEALIADPELNYPTGDTVGRNEDERILVQRQENPTRSGPPVLRLDMPSVKAPAQNATV